MSWQWISQCSFLLLMSFSSLMVLGSDAIATAAELQPPLPQHPQIQVYFNRNPANRYTDSYRQVSRLGDNLEAIVITQIASAQQSIDIAVTGISLPGVAQALVERQRAGVRVRLITDNDYVKPWGTLSIDEVADLDSDDQDLWAEFDDLIDADKDGDLSPEEVADREIYTLLLSTGQKFN